MAVARRRPSMTRLVEAARNPLIAIHVPVGPGPAMVETQRAPMADRETLADTVREHEAIRCRWRSAMRNAAGAGHADPYPGLGPTTWAEALESA